MEKDWIFFQDSKLDYEIHSFVNSLCFFFQLMMFFMEIIDNSKGLSQLFILIKKILVINFL